jgi:hypothetical protein
MEENRLPKLLKNYRMHLSRNRGRKTFEKTTEKMRSEQAIQVL